MTDVPNSYPSFIKSLKEEVRTAQVKAALAVNSELVQLYWRIGTRILEQQNKQGWGAKVIENISKDLRSEFPGMKGFGRANVHYMRKFAETYADKEIVQAVLGQISWYHNIALIDKLSSNEERIWYAQMAATEGWSRNVMVVQIESNLINRRGKSISNFSKTLPVTQSENVQEIIKDPYVLDFVSDGNRTKEKHLEDELVQKITKFLLELGSGFAYVGKQVHLTIDNKDYFIDLLFYHLHLRTYVVIELKVGEFRPEYAGKMNFYLSAADTLLRKEGDNPSIGLILCKQRSKVIAEWALKEVNKPIGVSEFVFTHKLPKNLKGVIPTPEELEKEMRIDEDDE